VSRVPHAPIRSCSGCGERAPQRELLCLSISPGGGLRMVDRRRRTGRTAYLHDRPACWERFASRKGPVRSLRRSVDKSTRIAVLQVLKAGEPAATMR
jgi:predicted RNA-binding protein YlxR (DUF448 family)